MPLKKSPFSKPAKPQPKPEPIVEATPEPKPIPTPKWFFVAGKGDIVAADYLGQGSKGPDFADLRVGYRTFRNVRIEMGGDPGSCYVEEPASE